MKKIIVVVFIALVLGTGQDMVVRVYAPSWYDLQKISPKYNLDIAGAHAGEWYDIVADRETMDKIIASGLAYELIVQSLTDEKERVRANYLSYDEVNDSLRQMALNYPSVCVLDSLPIPTYEGNWLYGVKISDNPYVEDDDEPGFLIDGLHHSREWACIPVVLFFADSMLRAYGSVSNITDIINTTEIYCFPIINADGYLFDYPSAELWRKNREPFGDTVGTDPNRNYGGCSGHIEGDWGAVDEGQATHNPSPETFCGAYINSGDETRALVSYVKSHTINAYMSYHSSGELIMWPWGWTAQAIPDAAVHSQVGSHMADMVHGVYGGLYDRGSIYTAIYAVSGASVDWVYSWCHWVGGRSILSYTTELGTTFYQPPSHLDGICRENFKALEYLAGFCDSIVLVCEGVVPPPELYPIETVNQDFTIYWHAKNPDDNNPTHWELVELSNPSVIEDDLESGTDRWLLDGFSLSATRAHSGTHSFFSGSTSNMNHAVRSAYPYLVETGDSVTFWCWYNLEEDYDVAVVEVSENTKEWLNLDTTRFSGNSGGWIRSAYSLEDWVGKSIYIRFRSMTDTYVLEDGFYVDDVYPVCFFETVDTVSSNITDTLYQFIDHPEGEYYFYVRGYNTTWGWGDYSCLEKTTVVFGIAESENGGDMIKPLLRVYPTITGSVLTIMFASGKHDAETALRIYDATGRLVKSFLLFASDFSQPSFVVWYGTDDDGHAVPAGIYFIQLTVGNYKFIEKAILLR